MLLRALTNYLREVIFLSSSQISSDPLLSQLICLCVTSHLVAISALWYCIRVWSSSPGFTFNKNRFKNLPNGRRQTLPTQRKEPFLRKKPVREYTDCEDSPEKTNEVALIQFSILKSATNWFRKPLIHDRLDRAIFLMCEDRQRNFTQPWRGFSDSKTVGSDRLIIWNCSVCLCLRSDWETSNLQSGLGSSWKTNINKHWSYRGILLSVIVTPVT